MVKQITEGVCVSVETFYQPEQSNPLNSDYLFAYRITIDNFSSDPVQLLRRHWYIMDSAIGLREVEGEGVVGQTPIIEPNGSYQYISACNLKSDMGKMYGTYQMINHYSKKPFQVAIPEFQLVTPFKAN